MAVRRRRKRPIQKAEQFARAHWYIARGWPVVAIAAIVKVTPNTIRAWARRMHRERVHRQFARLVGRAA